MDFNTPLVGSIKEIREKGTLLDEAQNLYTQLISYGSKWFIRFSTDLPIYPKAAISLVALKCAIEVIPQIRGALMSLKMFEQGELNHEVALNQLMNAFDDSPVKLFRDTPTYELLRGVIKNIVNRVITNRINDFDASTGAINNPTFSTQDLSFLGI